MRSLVHRLTITDMPAVNKVALDVRYPAYTGLPVEHIDAVLPELDEMIGGGLITLERVNVIMYRAPLPPEDRTGSWPISRLSPATPAE